MLPLPSLSPEQRAIALRVSPLARETIGEILCGLRAATFEFQ